MRRQTKMAEYKIREMKKSDLVQLAKLDASTFSNTDWKQSLKVFQDSLKNQVNGACLVAEIRGRPIAAIFIKKTLTFHPNSAYVTSFFVSKESRGMGIGGLLLKKSLSMLKKNGIKNLTLTVEEKNEPALKLYAENGFKKHRLLFLKKL